MVFHVRYVNRRHARFVLFRWLVQAIFAYFVWFFLRLFSIKNNWQMVILFLQLCAYACISGVKDGILWSKKGADAFAWNEHLVLVAERACIGSIVLLLPLLSKPSFLDVSAVLLSFCMCFPFLHNGSYYTTRRYIDVDYYHWFSESKSSSAKFNLGIVFRITIFFVGLIGFGCYLYFR